MNEPTIICPIRKSEIKLTESLAAPLIEATRLSAHPLRNLRANKRISDKSLFPLVRAAEQLRRETKPVEVENTRWLQKARDFLSLVGSSQHKLAKMLGVSGPYLGRVLRGEKPMTAGMIERIRAISI